MKKTMYILGSVEALLGCLILCVISVLKEWIPIMGRIAYQYTVAGGYSSAEYQVYFSLANTVAVVLIAAGIAQVVVSFFKKN